MIASHIHSKFSRSILQFYELCQGDYEKFLVNILNFYLTPKKRSWMCMSKVPSFRVLHKRKNVLFKILVIILSSQSLEFKFLNLMEIFGVVSLRNSVDPALSNHFYLRVLFIVTSLT